MKWGIFFTQSGQMYFFFWTWPFFYCVSFIFCIYRNKTQCFHYTYSYYFNLYTFFNYTVQYPLAGIHILYWTPSSYCKFNKKWWSLTQVTKMSGLHVGWLLLKCCRPATWKGVHVGRNGIDCNMTWSCSLQQGMIFSAFLWGIYRIWGYNFSKKLLKIKIW